MTPIPWTTKTIGSVCEKPQYGFTESAAAEPVGPRFLRITDLREGNLHWPSVPYCRCSGPELDKFQLTSGDLVVARIGATTGRTSLILNPPEAVFASYLIRLRPRNEINPFFLYFFTQSRDYWVWIDGNKDTNLKGGVNATLLAEIKIPFPSKLEQEKIAVILWKVQRAIETEEKLVATARELKQSAMRQLFTHGLRGEQQKQSEIGLIPKSWEISAIGSRCAKPEYGLTASATSEPVGPVFLRITDITESGVNWNVVPFCQCSSAEEKLKKLRENDILFARIGATTGKSFIVKNPPRSVFASYLIRVRPLNGLDADYLYYFFNSDAYWAQVNANKGNNLKGGVNGSVLSSMLFPVPPLDEQKEIAYILQFINRKICLHERKRAALSDLFQTLLHQLMTAQIRVDRLDIDTSEVETAEVQSI